MVDALFVTEVVCLVSDTFTYSITRCFDTFRYIIFTQTHLQLKYWLSTTKTGSFAAAHRFH